MRYTSSVAVAVSLATIINAQTPNFDVSEQCASAFLKISSGENSECLNLSALLGVFTNRDQSIVNPVNTWIEGICTTDRCSDDTINEMFTNVSQACSSEAQRFNTALDQSSQDTLTRLYPSVREALCLRDTEADQYCVSEVLNDYQDALGTLSLSNVGGIMARLVESPPQSNITCTPCSKALYSVIRQDNPDMVPEVTGCGDDFNDGQMPTGIQLTADGQGGEGSEGAATALYGRGLTLAGIPAILAMGALLV